jgi:outer membrane protein assembly factor BamB
LVLVLPALALTLSACDWPEFGLYDHGTRDSADTGINTSTVASMKLDWTATTGGPVESSPAVVNGVVYMGSGDDKVYALNATTGATLWTATTGGAVHASPAVANGVVYVGSNDDKVYALNASTGATLWTATTGGAVVSPPLVAGSTVFVGSNDGSLYALNATTGATLWTANTAPPGASAPEFGNPAAVGNGIVYVENAGVVSGCITHCVIAGNLYALNASTGATLWSDQGIGGSSWPAVVNGSSTAAVSTGPLAMV